VTIPSETAPKKVADELDELSARLEQIATQQKQVARTILKCEALCFNLRNGTAAALVRSMKAMMEDGALNDSNQLLGTHQIPHKD